jgi:hypothetical protein
VTADRPDARPPADEAPAGRRGSRTGHAGPAPAVRPRPSSGPASAATARSAATVRITFGCDWPYAKAHTARHFTDNHDASGIDPSQPRPSTAERRGAAPSPRRYTTAPHLALPSAVVAHRRLSGGSSADSPRRQPASQRRLVPCRPHPRPPPPREPRPRTATYGRGPHIARGHPLVETLPRPPETRDRPSVPGHGHFRISRCSTGATGPKRRLVDCGGQEPYSSSTSAKPSAIQASSVRARAMRPS